MKKVLLALALTLGVANVQAQDVYVAAGQTPDFTVWSQFASWSWSQRVGFDVDYMGTIAANTAHCTTPGSIIVRIADSGDPTFSPYWSASVIEQALKCTQDQNNSNRMWVAGFNPAMPLNAQHLRKAVLHAIGHGLAGEGHTTVDNNVMYASHNASRADYQLTTADIDWALQNPEWSLYASPSYCHNELAPDNDILIPEVTTSGTVKRVHLNYIGVVNSYHTWTLNYGWNLAPSEIKNCSNNSQDGSGNITLTDVRGMNGGYSSATLQPWGGQWRLTSFTP
jgi:hypothetical protein